MATTNVPALLTKGIRKNYDILGDTYDVMGKKLFHVYDSNAGYEQVQGYVGYGLPQIRGIGQPIAESAIQQDFGKVYLHSNFGLLDVLPMELIDDDIYGLLTRWATSRAGSQAESYATNDEMLAANYLTNVGFASSVPVQGSPDGQPIFSLNHPVSAVDPTNLQSNTTSAVANMSMAALQAARANLEQQKKANGLTKIKNRIARVVFNPNIEEIVLQLLRSDWVPNTADRNMNTLQMRNIEPFSWPYWEASGAASSTAFNSWFVQGEEHYLEWYLRQAVRFKEQEVVRINSVIYASTQRQSLGHSNWRGLFGSAGS